MSTLSSAKCVRIEKKLLGFGISPTDEYNSIYLQNCNRSVTRVGQILSRTHKNNYHIYMNLDPHLYPINIRAFDLDYALLEVALNAVRCCIHKWNCNLSNQNVQSMNCLPKQSKDSPNLDRWIQISITDNGQGMSRTVKKNMFEYNFSTKKSQNHNGKALARVKKIIESFNGYIKVYTSEDIGTIFRMYFPAQKNGIRRIEYPNCEKHNIRRKMILLVDDETIFRSYAEKMLLRYGYEVISAGSATEGMILCKIYEKKINAILIDLTLSNTTDIQYILKFFLKLNPHIKLIATVGVGEKQYYENIESNIFLGFIQKPYLFRPLMRTVSKALDN